MSAASSTLLLLLHAMYLTALRSVSRVMFQQVPVGGRNGAVVSPECAVAAVGTVPKGRTVICFRGSLKTLQMQHMELKQPTWPGTGAQKPFGWV